MDLIEPLRLLFKDEVRTLGLEIELNQIAYGGTLFLGLDLPFVC